MDGLRHPGRLWHNTPMRALAIALEKTVGVLFIAAALSKALDMTMFTTQIAFYHVLPPEPWMWRVAAMGSLVVETVLGAMLIAGCRLRGLTYLAVGLLLLVFTGLIVYSWVYYDLADCGCFGKIVPMGPKASIAKNLAMLAALGVAGWGLHNGLPRPHGGWSGLAGVGMAAVGLSLFASANTAYFHPEDVNKERPFAKYEVTFQDQTWRLADGHSFVVVLTATCPYCRASVDLLNQLSFEMPELRIAGLVYADDDKQMQAFKGDTEALFPMVRIDGPTLFSLIEKEPPRFYHVQDGAPLSHLEVLEPSLETLLEFARKKPESPQ